MTNALKPYYTVDFVEDNLYQVGFNLRDLDFKVDTDGTLTVFIDAETDVQIDYFILS